MTIFAATDSIRFSVFQGAASQTNSTLQSAITDNEGFTFTITPKPGQTLDLRNAEFQFTWNREGFHAVRNAAVFSSIGGFSEGQQIFTTSNTPGVGAVTTTIFRLPEAPAYAALTAPVEFRLFGYGSQFAHIAQFHGVKLTRDVTSPTTYQSWAGGIPWNGADSSPGGDANGDGIPNLLAYSLVLDPRANAPADSIPTAIRQGNFLDFGIGKTQGPETSPTPCATALIWKIGQIW